MVNRSFNVYPEAKLLCWKFRNTSQLLLCEESTCTIFLRFSRIRSWLLHHWHLNALFGNNLLEPPLQNNSIRFCGSTNQLGVFRCKDTSAFAAKKTWLWLWDDN